METWRPRGFGRGTTYLFGVHQNTLAQSAPCRPVRRVRQRVRRSIPHPALHRLRRREEKNDVRGWFPWKRARERLAETSEGARAYPLPSRIVSGLRRRLPGLRRGFILRHPARASPRARRLCRASSRTTAKTRNFDENFVLAIFFRRRREIDPEAASATTSFAHPRELRIAETRRREASCTGVTCITRTRAPRA